MAKPAVHDHTVKFSILIPTLGRPGSLVPLARNIREVTEASYELIFVVDTDDKESLKEAKKAPGAEVVIADGTLAEKTNAGYWESEGELIVPTADDVWFHEGWDTVALKEMDESVHVLGTNDLTPITADGKHATMPIIRRSYIESPGCSWNDPGVVFHEGYHHGWVETEICQLAMKRDVWKFTKDSVIEHRHPDWGTRSADATDEKGNRQNKVQDEGLFESRRSQWC